MFNASAGQKQLYNVARPDAFKRANIDMNMFLALGCTNVLFTLVQSQRGIQMKSHSFRVKVRDQRGRLYISARTANALELVPPSASKRKLLEKDWAANPSYWEAVDASKGAMAALGRAGDGTAVAASGRAGGRAGGARGGSAFGGGLRAQRAAAMRAKLSLLDIFKANTPAGERRLRAQMLLPLTRIDQINARLDIIELLMAEDNQGLYANLKQQLQKVGAKIGESDCRRCDSPLISLMPLSLLLFCPARAAIRDSVLPQHYSCSEARNICSSES